MNRALQSGAIVSSLFPEEVAHKLYEEHKAKYQKEEKKKNFINSGDQEQALTEGAPSVAIADSNQIAQVHPDCTIFFADLAGFTKWSSTREPTHVFKLLETLYGAFDQIAERRRVFKIETIGYVQENVRQWLTFGGISILIYLLSQNCSGRTSQ